MKLPNKYGSVSKLTGKRRRPFMVREGKTGKQEILGYTTTYEDGLQMLAEYNKKPWDIENKSYNLEDLFQLWLENKSKKLGNASLHSLKSAWKHCQELKEMEYSCLKVYQMQDCIDNCGCGYATQGAIKNLFQHLEKFARELEISDKNCASLLTVATASPEKKSIFTEKERKMLWQHQSDDWVDSVLIFLHTGFRISELLDIKKEQVDLEKRIITGGGKTEAGKNRVIPIHPDIMPFILDRMSDDGEYLLSYRGEKCDQQWYRSVWKKKMEQFSMNHTPHECRHTFRSLLDTAGANPVCIDRLMGHRSQGTGERIYTHKSLDELRENLELVTV